MVECVLGCVDNLYNDFWGKKIQAGLFDRMRNMIVRPLSSPIRLPSCAFD